MPSLKKRSEFLSLRNDGQFFHATHWLAVSYVKNDIENLRWGWTLSRKVGKAVIRNRLKRWGRENVREFKSSGIDINFIFKVKNAEFYRNLPREEFDKAIEKAFKKIS